MRLTRLARQITTYRLRAASDGEHRLLIEQPLLAGWSLATPDPTHVEFSADGYRIPVTLTGSKQNNVVVTMERPLEETIRLLDLADNRLGVAHRRHAALRSKYRLLLRHSADYARSRR